MMRFLNFIFQYVVIPTTVLLIGASAWAAQTVQQRPPLEITARQTLEWRRNDLQYVAKGDVVAKQGDTTIKADNMTAYYKVKTSNDKDGIYRLTATGHVRITGQGATASGDRAVYDVAKGLATMTGTDLTMTSPDQTVTAKDRFEYWTAQGKLSAIGHARAIRTTDHGADMIDADTLSALFTDNPQDHRKQLTRLEARGHVVITTPTEILRGDNGDYFKATDSARLYGHVTITRGPNILEGESADIDLKTNISRMHAGSGPNARVRGVFYPGTQPGEQAADARPTQPSVNKPVAAPDWRASLRPAAQTGETP